MKSVLESGAPSPRAAATPPHRPWPMTTIEVTPSSEHRELERRARRVIAIVGRVHGHEPADVAHHEQLAWQRIEHHLRARTGSRSSR